MSTTVAVPWVPLTALAAGLVVMSLANTSVVE